MGCILGAILLLLGISIAIALGPLWTIVILLVVGIGVIANRS